MAIGINSGDDDDDDDNFVCVRECFTHKHILKYLVTLLACLPIIMIKPLHWALPLEESHSHIHMLCIDEVSCDRGHLTGKG